MSAHELLDESTPGLVRVSCSCGRWRASRPVNGEPGRLSRNHAQHVRDVQRSWFQRTGHCGACGQPGGYCLCTTRCACADLHAVGSGLAPDAVAQFAEHVVSDGQEELFG